MKTYSFYIIITLLLAPVLSFAKPRVDIISPNGYGYSPTTAQTIVVQRLFLNANNISTIFQNTGIFNQDTRTQNNPGFEWPKGSNKFACFTAGLTIGCFIDGRLAEVSNSYAGEMTPGYISNLQGVRGDQFKIYSIKSGDNASNNPDFANWGLMTPFGAPYLDSNHNGQYDAGIDIPGQKDASQTIFITMSDAFLSERNPGEGFGGGVTDPLLLAEVHLTAWSYNTSGLEDIDFIKWDVINKNNKVWDRTFFGVVVDPDLGDQNDDFIGCDTNLNLGYCYNGDNSDDEYGSAPPAFGMDYFKSPIEVNGVDTTVFNLTSFVYFTNTSTSPPPCEADPNGDPVGAYNLLTGVKKDSTVWINPQTNQPTKFCYPGDPETHTGWTELGGSIQNCNRTTTGTTVAVNPVGDRRFIFNSGSFDFQVQPNDTQHIVLAQFVAKGSDNLNSVTKLKNLSATAQKIYDANFNVIPPPPPPVVTYNTIPAVIPGTAEIQLTWGDESESFKFLDNLFQPASDSSYYIFQGYEIYELDKSSSTYPDFTKPETIDNTIKLLQIYDKVDNIGIVIDTFSTGLTVNGSETFAPFPIVPYYTAPVPPGFPNTGINRSYRITRTNYPQNYGGRTELIYGQEYDFAVLAYAVKTNPMARNQKVDRNSLLSAIIRIIPTAPPLGTQYAASDGDTLFTNRRDLGVIPIIMNQDSVKTAKYRIVFQSPDTTYNVLRSFDGGNSFETLRTGLKFDNSAAQDSSKIIDGILMKVKKIRTGSRTISDNVGVIKDPPGTSDSLQARLKGWDYDPPQNRFVEGSKFNRGRVYESVAMSLSWPTLGTFTNLKTSVTAEQLRTIRLEFTGPGSGQMAYRYLDTSTSNDNFYIYQNMVEVPFKAFEVDPYDSSAAPRQVNVIFVVSNDVNPAPAGWEPSADSLGGKLVTYILNSNYSSNPDPFYTSKNLFISQASFDIQYVWAPKLISGGSTYRAGDKFTIYPYTVTRPEVVAGMPLYYEFDTRAAQVGVNSLASQNDLDKINVVPNPYYGFSTLDRSIADRFVSFRNLPMECTIKIYTLNGDLVKNIRKTSTAQGNSTASTAEWNMTNLDNSPVASGIYLALIDAPGIGQKVLKVVIFTAQERVKF